MFGRYAPAFSSSTKGGQHTAGRKPSRDNHDIGTLPIGALRNAVMEEVAIPGKYQMYFKPDKRAVRKAEGSITMERSRPSKKIAAAKWNSTQDRQDAPDQQQLELQEGSRPRTRGFDNVATRALEQIYAREVLPHPYFHRDYLDFTEDQIAGAVVKHATAFKAMLARHSRHSTSSRLVFQLTRQSDRQYGMAGIWKELEHEAHLHADPMEETHFMNGRKKKY
ncbi:hypothetical protein BGZ51_001954 [Haplosporangium sp. Z 767]|nr:hypothetical protein BGZ50_005651 [Haplosporangium sp. Z 11]KAF9186549.1 hypothetical protein BGZ51_001954 [Haplosporangium sp. Z 767]